jgi:hypothetical protein
MSRASVNQYVKNPLASTPNPPADDNELRRRVVDKTRLTRELWGSHFGVRQSHSVDESQMSVGSIITVLLPLRSSH